MKGLDEGRLADYLGTGPLTAELVQGGRSNLTYFVSDGQSQWVVRRPPLGHVLSTAHDMAREFQVIRALAPTAVPVPEAIRLCQDEEVLGAPFYVMSKVEGHIYRRGKDAAALGAQRLEQLSYALVDVLADLHAVEPGEVGLADFGRPEGYLERNLRRWAKQLEGNRSRPIAGIDELRDRLAAGLPATLRSGIIHGDYRLDNAIATDDDRIAAVLDWEMATLGDQLTDLGLLVMYWQQMINPIGPTIFGEQVSPELFPTADQLIERYARRTGTDLSRFDWYLGFACFKLAVILEGIHFRFQAGQTLGAGFDHIGEMVPELVARGHQELKEA